MKTLNNIFLKFFCLHEWQTHVTKNYEWIETSILDGTQFWAKPKFVNEECEKTIEILICKKCGNIKKIEY